MGIGCWKVGSLLGEPRMRLRVLQLALLCLLTGGCASYSVKVNGYLDKSSTEGMPAGAGIHVVENPQASNLLLQREIALKIEELLEGSGYSRASYEKAPLLLLFEYGVDAGHVKVNAMPARGGDPSVAATSYRDPSHPLPLYDVSSGAALAPYPSTVYGKWLSVKVVEGEAYRGDGQVRQIWVGEATIETKSADLREAVDYMLVALFENFGLDTRRQLRVELDAKDPRVIELGNR